MKTSWNTSHSDIAQVAPERVWVVFEALRCGNLWLPGTARFTPDGPLEIGTRINIAVTGRETMATVITDFQPPTLYADTAEVDGMSVTSKYNFATTEQGTRITHTLTITGGTAETAEKLGTQLSSHLLRDMDALIAAVSDK